MSVGIQLSSTYSSIVIAVLVCLIFNRDVYIQFNKESIKCQSNGKKQLVLIVD